MSLTYPMRLLPPPIITTPMMFDNPDNYTKRVAIKNSNGWYKQGMIAYEFVAWRQDSAIVSNVGRIPRAQAVVYKSSMLAAIPNQDPTLRMCLLKIPINFYCEYMRSPSDLLGDLGQQSMAMIYDWCTKYVKDNSLYTYILVSNVSIPTSASQLYMSGLTKNSDDGKQYSSNRFSITNFDYLTGYSSGDIDISNVISSNTQSYVLNDKRTFVQSYGWQVYVQRILDYRNNYSATMLSQIKDRLGRYLSYSTADYQPYPSDMLVDLKGYINQSEILSGLYYSNILGTFLTNLSFSEGQVGNSLMSTNYITDLPVFSVKTLDQMENYFGNKDYEPDNKDELAESLAEIPTRWDVYINGNNRPEITVTCHSNAWEVWQGNPENNTAGIALNSANEQYHGVKNVTVDGNDIGTDSAEYELSVISYDGNFLANYQQLISEQYYEDLNDFGEGGTELLHYLSYPVILRMRLNVPILNIFSSWCECAVGIIGNPELEDFGKMLPQNYGKVLGISDGSEIYLHYNDYPDDSGGGTEPPVPPPDPPVPPDVSPSNGTANTALTRLYKVTPYNLDRLGNFMWNATFLDSLKLLNNNPMENVISLLYAPVNVDGTASTITIGNVPTGISADLITTIPIQHVGHIALTGMYGTFLDYAPYTNLSVFLPFIGFYNLDTNVYIGQTIDIYYAYDLLIGSVKALMYVNNVYVQSFDGAGAIDIELTGSNKAQRAAQILQSSLSLVPSAVEAAVKKDGESIGNFAKGAYATALNAVFMPYHSQRSGSYSPRCGEFETRKIIFVLDYPNAYYPANYGHTRGYALNKNKKIGQCKGLTICDGYIDMSNLQCTEMEKDMIRELLAGGIYV